MPSTRSLLTTFALSAAVLAKTDLAGCTSSADGASMLYWVPGTGEICELLDCGGGRAPPKSSVCGCPAYTGTETYAPKYLTFATVTATTSSAEQSETEEAVATASPTTFALESWGPTTTWASSEASAVSASEASALSSGTAVAPAVTSMATSFGTAATIAPSLGSNGTTLSGTASPSATPSSLQSNNGVATAVGPMMALAVAAFAGFALV